MKNFFLGLIAIVFLISCDQDESLVMFNSELNVKVMLEGPYNGTTMKTSLNQLNLVPLSQPYNVAPFNYAGGENVTTIPVNVVDWVLVDVRISTSDYIGGVSIPLFPRACFITADGKLMGTNGALLSLGTIPDNNLLFIKISHRNHKSLIGKFPLIATAGVYQYDFTDNATKAVGLKNMNGVFVMTTGDINQDGLINMLDYDVWVLNFGHTKIYNACDLDFDGNIYVSDYGKWAGNAAL